MAATLRPSPLFALFFDPSHFDPLSEQTDDSKRKSDGSRPAHSVGERRRHDLMPPLLYPRRERAKLLSGGGSVMMDALDVLFSVPSRAQPPVVTVFTVLMSTKVR
jgi:hypothetical protein